MIDREDLHQEKCASIVIAMLYIELFSQLQKKYAPSLVAEKLHGMGRNIASTYFQYYQPHKTTISGLVREIAEELAGIKNITLKRVDDGFTIATTDCPLCMPGIEIEGPHYCYPTMGILEEMINASIQARPDKFQYKGVVGSVVRSISAGADACEYHFRLIKK